MTITVLGSLPLTFVFVGILFCLGFVGNMPHNRWFRHMVTATLLLSGLSLPPSYRVIDLMMTSCAEATTTHLTFRSLDESVAALTTVVQQTTTARRKITYLNLSTSAHGKNYALTVITRPTEQALSPSAFARYVYLWQPLPRTS